MNSEFWCGTLDLVHAMEAEGDGGVAPLNINLDTR